MSTRNFVAPENLTLTYKQYVAQNYSLVGTSIEPYTVLKKIGQGSFGSVYLATEKSTNFFVAIKVLDFQSIRQQKDSKLREIKLRLYKRQVENMTLFDHQNLIKCFQVHQNNFLTLLVMQYCNGGTLQRKVKSTGRMNEKVAINILRQILNGLSVLHKNGIIHRDLKPQNILIHNGVYKIADFGFSKQLESNDFINEIHHTNLGTLCTMSPQVLQGKQYGLQADIWSIGVIFYYMIFGKYPYQGSVKKYLLRDMETKDIFNSNFLPNDVKISQSSKSFILQCLEMDSQKRPNWQNILTHEIFRQQNDINSVEQINFNQLQKLKDSFNELNQLQTILQNKKTIKIQQNFTPYQNQTKKCTIKDIQPNRGFYQTKLIHFQYLRAQFIMKQILQPLQMCSKKSLQVRQIVEILFLVTCRCYEDISLYKNSSQSNKDKYIFSILKMVKFMYERLFNKLQKYSLKLLNMQNNLVQIIKTKIFSIIQYRQKKERQIFFARAKSNQYQEFTIQYSRQQQVKYTQKLINESLSKISSEQSIDSKKIIFIKNYNKICNASFNDVGNAYFRTYITNLCQKS